MSRIRVAGLLVVAYACLFVLSRVIHATLFGVAGIQLEPTTDYLTFVAGITLPAAIFIVVVNRAIAGRLPRPQPRRLATYMSATLFLGIAIEILLDGAAVAVLGRKAWEYEVWPLHDGYTSGVAAFMWPLYGAHLCMLDAALETRGVRARTQLRRSMVAGVDAMVMEIAANTWAIAVFGTYYFYYLAPDLMHFTAAEIYLPYVGANLLLAGIVRTVDRAGRSWPVWCAAMTVAALAALFLPAGAG